MWDWIKAYKVPFYETFWKIQGWKEYEFIYKSNIIEDFINVFKQVKITDEKEMHKIISNIIEDSNKKASIHFGQPYFNSATIAGLYRILLKEFANSYNIKL